MIIVPVEQDAESLNEVDSTEPGEMKSLRWEALDPYKDPAFLHEKGLFSRGDVFSDYSAAIKAIGAGRRAAASVHEVMYGISLEHPANVVTPDSYIQNVDRVEDVGISARNIMPLCNHTARIDCREVELGFDEQTARAEADRCLQCGLICYLRNQPVEGERKLEAGS